MNIGIKIMIKKIQISDEYFWGFHRYVNLDNYKSFDDLAIYMKKELIIFLKQHNLLCLEEKAMKMKLHNHMYNSYDDLYKSDEDTIIYLCGHCNSNDSNNN